MYSSGGNTILFQGRSYFILCYGENMKKLFFFFIIPIIVITINSCANSKEDTSGALAQMDQALNQPNRTDDEVDPVIPNVFISSCYRLDNSNINNSTVDNSTITDNSIISNSNVKNCSSIFFSNISSSTIDNSTIDNSTVTGNSTIRNSSSVCNSTIDNSTIDNSTICYGAEVMSIVNRTVQNQIMTESVAPYLILTSPADNTSTNNCNTSIFVDFSEPMNTTSIRTTVNTTCSGSIQVSDDNSFGSCVPMSSQTPTSSISNTRFTLTPTSALINSTIFFIKVTKDVKDPSGNTISSDNTTGTGFNTAGVSGKKGC